MSNQPQLAKRKEYSVIRKIIALIIVNFSDVLAVQVATNQRPQPTLRVVSDGRAQYVEAPDERADVKPNHDTADRAKESEGSHLGRRECRLTRKS